MYLLFHRLFLLYMIVFAMIVPARLQSIKFTQNAKLAFFVVFYVSLIRLYPFFKKIKCHIVCDVVKERVV